MAEIIHMVPLELRDDADEADIERALAASRSLAGKVEGLREALAGADVSVEGMGGGFTHAIQFRFADPDARDRFVTDPAHLEAATLLRPLLTRAIVIEVEA
jgi:hypothetical protein